MTKHWEDIALWEGHWQMFWLSLLIFWWYAWYFRACFKNKINLSHLFMALCEIYTSVCQLLVVFSISFINVLLISPWGILKPIFWTLSSSPRFILSAIAQDREANSIMESGNMLQWKERKEAVVLVKFNLAFLILFNHLQVKEFFFTQWSFFFNHGNGNLPCEHM